jgi:hypothetical protein
MCTVAASPLKAGWRISRFSTIGAEVGAEILAHTPHPAGEKFLYVLNAGLTARSGRRVAATSRSGRGRPPRWTAQRPHSRRPGQTIHTYIAVQSGHAATALPVADSLVAAKEPHREESD